MDRWLIVTGLVGTAMAALCCFTPALTIILGIAGLSLWRDSVDRMALPALVLFAIVLYAGVVLRRRRIDEDG